MNIKLPEQNPKTTFVFQINCGESFYIGHTTSIDWLRKELASTYGRYHRGGIPDSNLFYKLLRCYHAQEKPELRISVVLETDNGYEILKQELLLLAASVGTKGCLNESYVPYIPKTVHANKGSNWLTQNQYLNFMRLLKRYKLKAAQ